MTDTPLSRLRPDMPHEPLDETIDLKRLAHSLWRRKGLVVGATLAGAVLGFGLSALGTRYVSEGLLLMPNVDLADYKRFEVALANEPRLEEFLTLSGRDDEPVAGLLRNMVRTPGQLATAVRPEFTHTERDVKLFGVKFDQPGELIGVRLRLQQKDRSKEAPVLALADYVRDTALKVDVESNLLTWCLRYEAREQELRNEQLEGEFALSQQEAKAATLRRIIASTPGASQIDGRQVVSIENGGERFLSPVAQLVATETLIGDVRLEHLRRERDRTAAVLKKEYYCEAGKLLSEPILAREFLTRLGALHERTFAGKDLSVNILAHTANALALQRRKWHDNYLARTRFVASPAGAQVRERQPGRVTGTVAGAVLGGLTGVLLALFATWWRVNRAMIVASDD